MLTSLSPYELHLVTDAEILLAKNKIIQKVYNIYGGLAESYKASLEAKQLVEVVDKTAKISRGENYKGLPYVILDYPRQFSKESIFAIRSFFWWGNFFSITLHLSGNALKANMRAINISLDYLKHDGWMINAGEEEWEHHFESNNYQTIEPLLIDFPNMSFVKLAKKIPLHEWDNITDFYTRNFDVLINTMAT